MTNYKNLINEIFVSEIKFRNNFITLTEDSDKENQKQTNKIFTEKWQKTEERNGVSDFENFQKEWYLSLYGFESEGELRSFLTNKRVILDAGCGLGYKAAWFATLSPESIVIGMDFSDSVVHAAKNYIHIKNLFFIKGDIADTNIKISTIDYINCDQVIHHTEFPEQTFKNLSSLLSPNGEFACYVYAKKALPRELIDDYFRDHCKNLNNKQLWDLSKQLTELGRNLSDLKVQINIPDIPALNIRGGSYDIQRFIYWNFLKCFWNEELGHDFSVECNFDWYAPSNAKRYSEEEYKQLILDNNLQINYFHSEEACFSGRFSRDHN